jgi:hypothetical protein
MGNRAPTHPSHPASIGSCIASDGDDVPELGTRWTVAMMNRRPDGARNSHRQPLRCAATSPTDVPSCWHGSRGRLWAIVLVTALDGFAIATVALRTRRSDDEPALPATPTAWLDAFSAGVARDSGDVCSRLLSPAFRSAMESDAPESCAAYYARSGARSGFCGSSARAAQPRSRSATDRAARCRSPDARDRRGSRSRSAASAASPPGRASCHSNHH